LGTNGDILEVYNERAKLSKRGRIGTASTRSIIEFD